MMKTKGYAAFDAKTELKPFSFERREPGPYDVQIDIHYCGICHSDIHQARNEWGGSMYPMVPGHEIVGTVARVGAQVKRWKKGDRVGVGCIVDSCRTCESCKEGLEQYCESGMIGTYNALEKDGKTVTQGGYSKHIVVNEDFVLKLPENLPLDKTAPLLCAGITLYSPLKHWHAGPGKKVAIVGLGGLGHVGVKIAHAMGADVTILSHSLRKKEDGLKMGASQFYSTTDTETFQKLEGKFDLIVNTVSSKIDWNQLLTLLKRDGTMVNVGAPDEPIPVSAFSLVFGRRSLAGSLIGGLPETQEMLDFCGKHNITADIELISMDRVNEAYERMLRSDVKYRFVIDVKSFT